jgi:hypothetical protein
VRRHTENADAAYHCVKLLRSTGERDLKQVEFKIIWYISVRHLPPPKRHKSHETGELLVNQHTIPNSYQHERWGGRKESEKDKEKRKVATARRSYQVQFT